VKTRFQAFAFKFTTCTGTLRDTGIRRLTSSIDAAAAGGGSGGCCWQAAFSPTTPGLIAAACGDGRVSLLDTNAPGGRASSVGSVALVGTEGRAGGVCPPAKSTTW
jgi:hypothetical protein